MQQCVSELQIEGNVTLYSDVSEVQGEGNIIVYSDLSELQGEGKFSLYRDMRLKYRVRENLLYSLMCL